MFPSHRSMHISAVLGKLCSDLASELAEVQHNATLRSSGEVAYFRNLFPAILLTLNGKSIDDLYIRCIAKEIHQRPIVIYGKNRKCELGDYFVNVKYYDEGKILGRKLVIYQFKWSKPRGAISPRSKRRRRIDDNQLTLLRDWPTFAFGNAVKGRNTFTLSPSTPD